MEGTTLSERYEILGLLGEGGMARVYRARDRHLQRDVAVKILRDVIASDPESLQRFRREARSAASLTHPGIVRVYDYIETPEHAFLVMELVEGATLRDRVRGGGPMVAQDAVEVACQILTALEHAHAAGVIHRDLSARNVLIDGRGVVRVSDFGIARALGDRTLTQSGHMVGSVQYIAPEQARGEDVGPPADLYAVGVLLYEMLTAELPFSAENPVQLALKHVSQPPTPPSELRSDLEEPLEAVVLKALSKDPGDRYPTAREMRSALEGLGRREAVPKAQERTLVRTPAVEPPRGRAAGPPDEEDGDEPPSSSGCGPGLLLGLALLFLVVGALAFWAAYRPKAPVDVPALAGMSLDEAQRLVEGVGLRIRVQDQRFDEQAAANTILAQSPEAGKKLRPGEGIDVVVSRGARTLAVPDLAGLTISRAEAELSRLGLTPRVRKEDHASIPVGVVIRQDPAAGSNVTQGTPVEVVISSGSGKSNLPNLVGMTREEAEEVLKTLEMEMVIGGFQHHATHQEETVLEQSPSAGALVPKGQKVRVVLSRGRADLRAPDIEGKTIREARALCAELGLELVVEGGAGDDEQIVFQRPLPGEPMEGTSITVQADASVVVPEVRGRLQAEAEAEVRRAGLAVGKVVTIPMSGSPVGEVVNQEPLPGVEVPTGSAVDLYVSDPSAPPPDPVDLPDVEPTAPPWVPDAGTPPDGAVEAPTP